MSVHRISDWRLAGCGDACIPRSHDPQDHEAYGYRMAQERPTQTYFEIGGLAIDTSSATVIRYGDVLPLTAREWQLLAYLLDHADQWCKADDVAASIWGDAAATAFRVVLSRLRGKLEADRNVILHRTGFGYMLRSDASKPLPMAALPEWRAAGRWARDYDACAWCKRTDRVHRARGLCYSCHGRQKHAGRFQ